MSRNETQLLTLLKARCPLIYVVSPDEERVERKLLRLADQLQIKLSFWSVTQGVFDRQGESGGVTSKDIRDPLNALRMMGDHQGEAAIFVLRDFHDHIGDVRIKRQLRDLAKEFRAVNRTCVVLSPQLVLPPELEAEVEVLHFDPPSQEEQRRFLNRFLSGMKLRVDDERVGQAAEALVGLSAMQSESLVARSLVQTRELDLEFLHTERARILQLGSDPVAPGTTLSEYATRLSALLDDPGTRRALLALALHPPLRRTIVEAVTDRWPEALGEVFD